MGGGSGSDLPALLYEVLLPELDASGETLIAATHDGPISILPVGCCRWRLVNWSFGRVGVCGRRSAAGQPAQMGPSVPERPALRRQHLRYRQSNRLLFTPPLSTGELHVWRLELSAAPRSIDLAESVLSSTELAHARSFRFPWLVRRYVLPRAGLRILLSGYTREHHAA